MSQNIVTKTIISNQSTISDVKKSINSNNIINSCAGIVLRSDSNTRISIGSINRIQINVNGTSCCYLPGSDQEQYLCDPSKYPPACKTMSIIQSSDQDIEIVDSVNQTILTEQQKKMLDELNQQIKNDIMNMNDKQKIMVQQLLNLKSADDVTNTVMESLNADINTKLTVNTINHVIAPIYQSNSITLNVCGVLSTDNCVLDQNNVIHVQIKNYVNAVANVVQANPIISKINLMINKTIIQQSGSVDWISFCQNYEIEILLGLLILILLITILCLFCKNI